MPKASDDTRGQPPLRGGSNEYPQFMFWAETWKNVRIFYLKFFVFWVIKYLVYLNRRVFVMSNPLMPSGILYIYYLDRFISSIRSVWWVVVVVVVRIFNATRHPRHIEAAAIAIMYMYLYSLAFMDHPCTLGAAVCHPSAALSTLYSTQGTSSMS